MLCKHLLTVSRSLKGPEGNLEISLHFPSQRSNPFRQADFSEVIQSRYEPLLAGSAKLAKFGGIGASADFEGQRDARLGWPRSAEDTVERRESCLRHFASLGFLHVQASAISELQGTSVFGMPSNGVPNIISRETEGLARCHATKDDMDMRVVRVPVNHRRPLQWSAHIALDGTHDISCQPFEIYLFAKLWGQYNLKQPFVADLLPRGQYLCDVHGIWL